MHSLAGRRPSRLLPIILAIATDFMKVTENKNLKTVFWIIIGLILFFALAIPWRNYVYKKNLSDGKNLLAERNYTLALVKFQKAQTLEPQNTDAKNLEKTTRDSAANILVLRSFLLDEKNNDLLKIIDRADSKICDLDFDKNLIENSMSDVAVVNLEFCANNGPGDYQSWVFLGLANAKLADNDQVFSELKPGFRQKAADAFAKAYTVDPINKTAIEDSISIEKLIGDKEKVDYWQKLLDNLNRISK